MLGPRVNQHVCSRGSARGPGDAAINAVHRVYGVGMVNDEVQAERVQA
jgi:hypothetical protein